MIDAHAHLWDSSRFRYDWLADEPCLPPTYLPDDFAVSAPEIESFIFVQADCAAEEGFGEAAWVQSLRPTSGLRVAGIVAFAPLETNYAAPALAALANLRLVVGVRRLLQSEAESFFNLPALRTGLSYVQRHGWTFDACVRWHQLENLYQLARSHEALPVVIDHMGKPPLQGTAEDLTQWRHQLSRLAQLPNTTIKLSGLPAEATSNVQPEAFGPWLRAAYDLFGPHRAMIGSDWPVSSQTSLTHAGWFKTVRKAIAPTASEWDQVAGLTAERVYRLPRA